MQFQPKSEEELQAARLIPDGEYEFEVVKATDKISKSSSNEMIAVQLRVFMPDLTERTMYDWLVASDATACVQKIHNFCKATGILDAYFAGSFDSSACLGLMGRIKIGHKDDPQYGLQNTVKDYVTLASEPEAAPAAQEPLTPLGVPATKQRAAKKATEARNEANKVAGFPDEEVPF